MSCLLSAAFAQDLQGPVPPPNDVDPLDPVLAWSPRVPDAGPSAALLATFAAAPLVHLTGDPDAPDREVVLDDVVGANATFAWGFGRVGLGVSVPVAVSLAGSSRGFGLGSARIAVPISLFGRGAGALSLTPYLRGPAFGAVASDHDLPTGGIALSGGARTDRWAADGALSVAVDSSESGFVPAIGLAAGAGVRVARPIALRLDVTLHRSFPGRIGGQSALWLEAGGADGLRVYAGGGPGLGSAPGTPSLFGMVGVGWSAGGATEGRRGRAVRRLEPTEITVTDAYGAPIPAATVVVGDEVIGSADLRGVVRVPAYKLDKKATVTVRAPGWMDASLPEGPKSTIALVPAGVPLRLRVRDAGAPAAGVEVELRGPPGVEAPILVAGLDGYAASMRPGSWTLLVHAGDRSQEREIEVEPGRTAPMQVDVALAPPGPGNLTVRALDYAGHAVEGARVSIDGQPIGTTGSGGLLRVRAPAGRHAVAADADGYAAARLETASDDAILRMPYRDGAVLVTTLGPNAGPVDAVIRFEGERRLPPVRLGRDGRGVFLLEPGAWTLVAESPALGPQRRTLVVPPVPAPGAIDVPILLRPAEGGPATLDVKVIDADGAPVAGAAVTIDGVPVGVTSTGGSLAMGALQVTPRKISVEAEGFVNVPAQELTLAPGYQEHSVLLPYPEGTVEISATNTRNEPTDALIRLAGPTRLPPAQLGADGKERFQLAPGHWQLLASSSVYGNQTREVDVPRGPGGLIRVELKMRAIGAGNAELLLKVLGPDALPVNGAEVFVDGDSIGTTSNTGQLQTSGLTGGSHEIAVHAEAYRDVKYTLSLRDGALKNNTVALDYAPGAVRLQVRGQVSPGVEAPVADAILRLTGPRNLAPVRVDSKGERLFSLEPGDWSALVSSETYGIEQRSFTIGKADGLQQVPLVLAAPKSSEATLLVRVSDPSGQPVGRATIRVGATEATTSAGGAALLSGLSPGSTQLQVSAAGFVDASPPPFPLAPGSQTQFVTLDYRRQDVAITVVDPQGRPVDAKIGFTGIEYVSTRTTGEDGFEKVALRPGTWTIDVEADDLREQTVKVTVPGDRAPSPVTIRLSR